MSNNNSFDLFTAEFRHEAVTKFIKGLIEGSIKLPQAYNLESASTLSTIYSQMVDEIEQYVSGKIKGESLDNLEGQIFRRMAYMRAANLIQETTSQTQLQQEISALHKRMDSTNMLLVEVMKILQQLVQRHDK